MKRKTSPLNYTLRRNDHIISIGTHRFKAIKGSEIWENKLITFEFFLALTNAAVAFNKYVGCKDDIPTLHTSDLLKTTHNKSFG